MKNPERRRKVMARSARLGHCVCDPRRPCPCPMLKEKDICTCAGESPGGDAAGAAGQITDFVRSGGCAGKISQEDLQHVMAKLPPVNDPRLVVGTATADDAGVFRLTPDVTIVQTVDVFTPNVPDPRTYGRIAACNSLSDVYAMGGRPVTALSIIGFPIHSLPRGVMADILRGGMDILEEAGVVLLGGHSINDEEIKFGLSVTGLVRADELTTNAGAKPGDMLVLTKPLGTGIITFAHRIGRASARAMEAAVAEMTALNRKAAEIMVRHGATACTDVTGFGLVGHLCNIARESRVEIELRSAALPLLPDVLTYASGGMYSGSTDRNADYTGGMVDIDDDVPEAMRAVLHDPQTSGGLLIAFPRERAEAALAELHEAGIAAAAIIGAVTGSSPGGGIRVLPGNPAKNIVRRRIETATHERKNMKNKPDGKEAAGCCCSTAPAAGAMNMFEDFLGAASRPGAIDAVTKELIAVALALATNCATCTRIHARKAVKMGISTTELEEAAALAIAFGGCKSMVLWNEMKKVLDGSGE